MDEGLADALLALQDKFRCNGISGCAPQEVVIGYGWRATEPTMQQFARARRRDPWRPRTVRIVAELRDPEALPFLVGRLSDDDDDVVAHAIFGLVLQDYRDARDRIAAWVAAGAGLQYPKARLAARWALARWKEPGALKAFDTELHDRCRQLLAARVVQWGLELCAMLPRMDCRPHLRAAARHPGFVARREAVAQTGRIATRADARTLVMLAADPISSIRRRARAHLVVLSRRPDIQDAAGWQRWCNEGGCPPELPTASSATQR